MNKSQITNHWTQDTNKKGFTLIEILVVMVIIGILAVIAVGSFQSSQKKARDSKRKTELNQLGKALELYFNDKGSYPLSSANNKMLACNGGLECDWGDTFSDDVGTVYMIKLPADPASNFSYYYDSNGSYYRLYARLENNLDIDVPSSGDQPQVFSGLYCGELQCNYGIASSNQTLNTDLLVVE